MTLDDMISDAKTVVDDLEKRMTAKPTAELVERLGAETIAAQSARIEQRMARLEQQRTVTLARIDAALENERAALQTVRQLTERLIPAKNDGGGKPSRKAAKPR